LDGETEREIDVGTAAARRGTVDEILERKTESPL
jgi:hypothetical protein